MKIFPVFIWIEGREQMCIVQLILKESPGKLQNHKTNIYTYRKETDPVLF